MLSVQFGAVQGGIAILLIAVYNTSIKGKMSIKALVPLIIAGTANGLSDFSQKMFSRLRETDSISAFHLYTYIFAAVVLLIFYIFLCIKGIKRQEKASDFKIFRYSWGYILVVSLCLYINSYFKTLSVGYISSTQLYPLN